MTSSREILNGVIDVYTILFYTRIASALFTDTSSISRACFYSDNYRIKDQRRFGFSQASLLFVKNESFGSRNVDRAETKRNETFLLVGFFVFFDLKHLEQLKKREREKWISEKDKRKQKKKIIPTDTNTAKLICK